MMTALRAVLRWASLALLFLLIATPLVQIVMRSLFNVPMAGAEELARYFLIALTFVAAPLVSHHGGQIRMAELQALVPPRPRRGLRITIEAAALAGYGVLFAASVVAIANNLRNQTATLEMPFWLFMLPLAVGALSLTLEAVGALRAELAGRNTPAGLAERADRRERAGRAE